MFVNPVSELNKLDEPDYYHSHNTSMLWEQPLRSLDLPTIRLARLFSYLDPDSVSEQALNLNSCADIQNYLEVESGYVRFIISERRELSLCSDPASVQSQLYLTNSLQREFFNFETSQSLLDTERF